MKQCGVPVYSVLYGVRVQIPGVEGSLKGHLTGITYMTTQSRHYFEKTTPLTPFHTAIFLKF